MQGHTDGCQHLAATLAGCGWGGANDEAAVTAASAVEPSGAARNDSTGAVVDSLMDVGISSTCALIIRLLASRMLGWLHSTWYMCSLASVVSMNSSGMAASSSLGWVLAPLR